MLKIFLCASNNDFLFKFFWLLNNFSDLCKIYAKSDIVITSVLT